MYSSKHDIIVGQWTGKKYTLLKRLGTGGVGEIYLVRDSQARILALKLSTDIISITKEYRFLCRFEEKNFVPRVYDLDDYSKEGKMYHYFIKGYNLKTVMKENSIGFKTKLNLMCVIIQIIKQINEAGYIYTDLKHENIMVDGQNELIKLIDFGSLVQVGSSVREFTPMYDRLCWGRGKRIADNSYQSFAVAMLFISLMLNRNLDPNRDKLETALECLRGKKLPRQIFEIIASCLEGQIRDCDVLYNELSCAAQEYIYPDKLKSALNILIAVLFLLLTATIFVFMEY